MFHLDKLYGQASRAISTGQLNASLRLHTQPINLVIYEGPLAPCGEGDLILGRASRLYAFSGYRYRTQLPSAAPGGTTGKPEVRPSRSFRTMDSPPQISCACRG